MSKNDRRALALAVHLDVARSERDREAAARIAALAEVERLREQVVRLQAKLDALHAQQLAADAGAEGSRRRGLASLIAPPDWEAQGA